MIERNKYRLSEYKIIESEDGYIWWEAHSGFCSLKMGRCFIHGNILFIEPGQTADDNGFLKGDFLDQLKRLPIWIRTTYYCTNFNIVKCKAYQKIEPPLVNGNISQTATAENISFRLSQFEITVKGDNELIWKSYIGQKALNVGKAFVHSDILFLAHGVSVKTDILKKYFLEHLLLLPPWKRTKYFCRQYTLYNCNTNSQCHELDENDLSSKRIYDTATIKNIFPREESNFKPQNEVKNIPRNHLKIIWSFCSTLVLIILKVLFLLSSGICNMLKSVFSKVRGMLEATRKWIAKI
jgi:hypothetical protein